MYWKISQLQDSLRQDLQGISSQHGLNDVPCFFMRRYPMFWFFVGASVAAVVTFLLVLSLLVDQGGPVWLRALGWLTAGVVAFWSVLTWLAVVRSLSSTIRPFLLITPRVLLKVDHDDGELAGFLLSDAKECQAVRRSSTINPETSQKGLFYKFIFEGTEVNFRLTDDSQIQRLEKVLALARDGYKAPQGSSDGTTLIPTVEGSKSPVWLVQQTHWHEWLFQPWGLVWMLLGALLLLAVACGGLGLLAWGVMFGRG
jgi:hypothetical protein